MIKLKPIDKLFLKLDLEKTTTIKNPKFGKQWLVLCPAHNDINPSLKVTELSNGRVLLKCLSKNCNASLEDILDKFDLQLSDLNPDEKPSAINKLLVAFFNVEDTKQNNEWLVDCPVCKEHKLSITELPNRKEGCWPKCENNCDLAEILSAANLKVSDLKIKKRKKPKEPKGKQVAWYKYKKGDYLHHEVVRIILEDGSKITPVRHEGKNGKLAWGEGYKEKILYNYNDLLKTKGYERTRHVTEGEKNADRLQKEGYIVTTTLGGSGRWQETKDWSLLYNEKIIIYQDNDDSGETFAFGIAAFLYDKAKEIKIITPKMLGLQKPKEDIFDWLENCEGTKEKLDKIIEDCPIFDKYAAIREGVRKGDSPLVLSAIYDEAAKMYENTYFQYRTRDGKFIIGYVNWQKDAWIYKERAGYYKNTSKEAMNSSVWKFGAASKIEIRNKKAESMQGIANGEKGVILEKFPMDIKKQKEIYNALINRNYFELPEDASLPYWRTTSSKEPRPTSGNMLVFKNGILDITDLDNIVLIPSTPELFCPTIINVSIDPENPPPRPTEWFEWIDEWLKEPDAIRESQKWSGYCLLPKVVYKNMLCCVGHGDSGKTSWLYHLEAILGLNISYLSSSVSQLGDEYGLAEAPGKLVISIDDASWYSAKNLGVFINRIKRISGGSPADIRRMQTNPFPMMLLAKLIFASDDPPRFPDPGGQFATRWRYLKFLFDKDKHTREIYDLEELRKRIRDMIAGIVWHYSLPGLKMLEEDGSFINPKNTEDLLKDIEFTNRPYVTFYKGYCKPDVEEKGWTVPTVEVYLQWRIFCDQEGFTNLGSYKDQKKFTREFKRYVKGISYKKPNFYGFRLVKSPEL